ncbi:MAG: hypothetical protein N4A72_01595 [Bacteroidales bacterium]|jgi:hypothetical protein|nr:hypothetical protein [Bacteroidales bacterium]
MRGIVIILTLIFTMNYSVAQKSIATLLSVKGEAYVVRNRVKTEITIPYLFIYKDKIVVEEGGLTLLLCNGEEKTLKSGEEHTFNDDEMCSNAGLFDRILEESKVLNLQNRSAVSRSNTIKSITVFPKSSKMVEGTDSEIEWQVNSKRIKEVSMVLYDMETEDVVFRKDNITATKVNLKGMNLKRGRHYYWIIKPGGNTKEYLGVVSVVSEIDVKKPEEFGLQSRLDFIKAYSYFAEIENQFMLHDILSEANYRYPDTDLFKYLLKLHTGFDTPLYNTKNPNRKF